MFAAGEAGRRELEFLEQLDASADRPGCWKGRAAAGRRQPSGGRLDAAVMLEGRLGPVLRQNCYCRCPPGGASSRELDSVGWTETDFAAREAAQKSLTEKQALAEEVIDNSGSIEDTRAQVQALWQRLMASGLP